MPKCKEYKNVTGIYKIQNKINRHIYIGQASDIYRRWTDYDTQPFNPKQLNYNCTISKAIRKYGINAFEFSLVEECKIEELDEKEIYWIAYFDSYYHGYNETTGGGGSARHGIKVNKHDFKQLCQDLIEDVIPVDIIAEKYGITLNTLTRINQGKFRRLSEYSYPLRFVPCPICGEEKKDLNSVVCLKCAFKVKNRIKASKKNKNKNNKLSKSEIKKIKEITKPPISKEDLKKLIYEADFEFIGKQFNVSSTAVRKWCKKYGLPHLREEIICYSVQEWAEEKFDVIPYAMHKAKETEEEMIKLFIQGKSRAYIAEKYHFKSDRIRTIFKKYKDKIPNYNQLVNALVPVPQNIYQLNQHTLQIIKQYNSITDAEKEFGHSTVQPCLKGKHRTAGGYKWILCSSVPDLTIRDIVPEDKLPKYIRKTKTNKEGE